MADILDSDSVIIRTFGFTSDLVVLCAAGFFFSGGTLTMRINRALGIALVLFFSVGQAIPQPPDTLWTYTYASSVNDRAWAIAPTSDGGFVIGGMGRAPDGIDGALLIRLNSEGQQTWIRRYTEIYPSVKSVVATGEGSFASTGDRSEFFCIPVLRTDSAGLVEWSRCISQEHTETGISIVGTTDGGLAVLGMGDVIPSTYAVLVRLASNGDSLWARTLGPPGSYLGGELLATEDSGFLAAGSSRGQVYVVKTDSTGVVQWNITFGSASLYEEVFGAALMQNGDFVLAGAQERGIWTFNPYAARITAFGDTVWTRAFPSLGPGWFYSVCVLLDGNVVFGGSTGLDYLAVLVTPAGDTLWSTRYGTPISDDGRALCLAADGGLAMAGYKHTIASGSEDIWVVRTASALRADRQPFTSSPTLALLPNYPNPFNGTTFIRLILDRPRHINLSVYDITGRLVERMAGGAFDTGEHEIAFDGHALPSGMYIVRMEAPEFTASQKMMLVK